jgi:hypothetical protein
MRMSDAVVECTAGTRYPDRPRVFVWEGERVVVAAVQREWRTPDGLVFGVKTADGRRFTLTYDEARDAWDIRLVRSRAGPKIRRTAREGGGPGQGPTQAEDCCGVVR